MTNATRNHRARKARGKERLFVARLDLTRHAAPHASVATPVGHLMSVILRRMNIDATHRLLALACTFNRAPTALNHIRQRHAIWHAIVVNSRHGDELPFVENLERVFDGYLTVGILHWIVFHNRTPLNHGEQRNRAKLLWKAGRAPCCPFRPSQRTQKRNADRLRRRTNANKQQARSRLDIVLTNGHESCEAIPFLIQCATNWKTSRRRVGNRALGSIATLGL